MKILQKVFKILSFVILGLLLITFTSSVIFMVRYRRWYENDFQQESSLVCLTDLDEDEKYEEVVEEKVESFVLSDSRTDFIVFTVEESLYILKSNIETGEIFEIEDMCLSTTGGVWQLYFRYRIFSLNLPWVVMDFVKDNRETAEIYVNQIKIGDVGVPGFVEKEVMVNLNRGISDAVIMLNENRFLGRTIDNIELLDDRVVFKGSR